MITKAYLAKIKLLFVEKETGKEKWEELQCLNIGQNPLSEKEQKVFTEAFDLPQLIAPVIKSFNENTKEFEAKDYKMEFATSLVAENEANICFKCVHRRNCPGDTHSRCDNTKAVVKGSQWGIDHGWFFWPVNFDPMWLTYCNGLKLKEGVNIDEIVK